MKFTAFLLLAACLQVSAKGKAQSITLSEKNAPLQKIFRQIQKQAPYDFVYSSELLQQAGKVTIDVSNANIEQVLQLCLKDKPLTYVIFEKTIVIKPKEPGQPQKADAIQLPPDPLTGIVVDEKGKPVVGASVIVKWPNSRTGFFHAPMGTQTDASGAFRLQAITANAVLYVSSVGFAQVQMPVNEQSKNLRIVLVPVETNLSEMVVTGYSTKKASEITGSVQSMNGDELRKGVSTANTLAMLKGAASGLYIVENGGSVATRGQVVMRGQATLSDASNTNFGPLIVLDGVITVSDNLQDIVDANDIESITMLKDAASAAIYGSRAAQGVLVVTTKRGQAGQLKVNLAMNYGRVDNHRLMDFMNTSQLTTHITKYMQAMYAASASLQSTFGSYQNYFNTTRIFTDADLNNNYDWTNNAFFTKGHQNDVNLSLQSGTDKTKFYGAIDWQKQDGTLLDDNLDRKSIRFNIDQKITDRLSFSLNTNAIIDKYTKTNSENQYYIIQPWIWPYYSNGKLADSIPMYVYRGTTAGRNTYYNDNPLYSHALNTAITKRESYIGTGRLKYAITPWLSVQTTNTFQYAYTDLNSYRDPRTYRGRWDGASSNRVYVNGELTLTDTRNTYWLTSNMLNFNKRFGQHIITALAGQEFGKTHMDIASTSVYNTPYPGERNLGAFLNYGTYTNILTGTAATPASFNTTAPVDKASFSLFGELNDNYKEKYFASVSARRDASTNFGKDKRYGNFYSVSGGWLLSRETFMADIRPVSNLKLRASYGTSGREAGADYLNFTTYNSSTANYNATSSYGSIIARLGNDNISWETTYTTNLGIDLGLWKRINLSVDYYNRLSKGLLQSAPLPSYLGSGIQYQNVGELRNRGVDIMLSTVNIQSKDFSWITSFNISFNQNKLVKVYGDSLLDGYTGLYYRNVGDDINTLKAVQYVGVNAANGRPQFQNVNADKSVTIVDSLPLATASGLRSYQKQGSATPKFFGGFTSTFRYKNITLSALFNFVYGNKIINSGVRNFLSPTAWQSGYNMAAPNSATRFWQGAGDARANYPNYYDIYNYSTRGTTSYSSSLLYQDASYLRLRNIRVSYDVMPALLQKAHISTLNIYLSADNVFVIKSKDLYAADPEGATIGSASNAYGGTGIASPMPRRFLAGINVGF